MKEKGKNKKDRPEGEVISRKEAMKKAGKYGVFTAASMLFFFSPKKVQAASELPDAAPQWDGW